jgi:hypothetical protein
MGVAARLPVPDAPAHRRNQLELREKEVEIIS